MVDRPPPSRFSVVERGGRLVVIDKETGQTPPTAAERMDLYDRKMGVEAIRPAARPAEPHPAPIVQAAPISRREPPRAPNERMAAAVAEMNRKQPWSQKTTGKPPAARIPQRSSPPAQTGGRKTVVTARWWDSKGPRTIELGQKGQAELTGGFMMLFFGLVIAAIVLAFVEPLILFVGVFALFRFGGNVLGPIGAGIIDKALAEKG
ncbi:hypothetical protein [Sphingopyxis sp. YR583]|uniref:hypothetical protein n=1 Tax=Sphingopyxis sp. YR583 TaxID=1881047 RepID=UPI000B09F969|nr:hypothetical protein [Sphingopyxis sp. YR583]